MQNGDSHNGKCPSKIGALSMRADIKTEFVRQTARVTKLKTEIDRQTSYSLYSTQSKLHCRRQTLDSELVFYITVL